MIKRIAATIVIFAMLLGSSNVYAVGDGKCISKNEDIIFTPFWEYALKVTPVISFSDGKYSGKISGNSNVTKISMTVVLSVKNSNGKYSEVSRTSKTSNTNVVNKSNSYDFVKGKTYKLTVTGKVYVDSTYENVKKSITSTY